jgi:FkbM family methyltransferase
LPFLGHLLAFFDLNTTVSLIESIFIENEYYFKSKNKKPNIIDLGSNIGLSVIYLKTLYPSCKIEAFEADSTTCKMLQKNINNYRFRNITVNNLAVTDTVDYVDFYSDVKGPGSPLMSTNPLRIGNKNKIKVKSTKLSKVIKKRIDFLKMDIEGSEYDVLIDLGRSKKIKLIDQINVEYHHHINFKLDNLSKFLKILENNNFGYQLHAGQNTPFDLKVFEDIQIHAYNKE